MKLPCDTCQALCCYHAPFNPKDFARIEKLIPVTAHVVDMGNTLKCVYAAPDSDACAFLDTDTLRCTIYDKRPRTCRDYGVNPQMPCQVLYPNRAQYLLEKAAARLRRKINPNSPLGKLL